MPADTPRRVWVLLAIGLVVASQSANIARLGHASPIAISAWRLVIATTLLALLARGKLRQLTALSLRDWGLLVVAGVALATHFFTWIAAVQLTTVANAATFFTTSPVFTALAAWLFFNERATGRLIGSIALGISGVALIGLPDLQLGSTHLRGDLLALACSVLFTVYFLVGKRLRRVLDTHVYVTAVYGVAAMVGVGTMLALQLPLVEYDGQTWLCFGLMAIGPTMIGHTSMNHALKWIPAGVIATATLIEPPLAALVAVFAWGEHFTPYTIGGYVLVAGSIVVLALTRRHESR